MSDLVEWLLEQIAEDERMAREAALAVGWRGFGDERVESGQEWVARYHVVTRKRHHDDPDEPAERQGVADCGALSLSIARHVAAFDPARVLAECAAKRRLIQPWSDAPGDDEDDWRYGIHATAHGRVLRLLALLYADRPGYLVEEWRP